MGEPITAAHKEVAARARRVSERTKRNQLLATAIMQPGFFSVYVTQAGQLGMGFRQVYAEPGGRVRVRLLDWATGDTAVVSTVAWLTMRPKPIAAPRNKIIARCMRRLEHKTKLIRAAISKAKEKNARW